jgi:hypothetical protein
MKAVMNLNIYRLQGIERGGFLHLLLQKDLTLMTRHNFFPNSKEEA